MSWRGCDVVGVDVGSVLTKVARQGSHPVVLPTVDRRELALLLGSASRLGVARSARAAGLVEPAREPAIVAGVLCTAAAYQSRIGAPAGARVHLVCDVGASTITAAVCVFDGSRVRLITADETGAPDIVPGLGVPADWFADQAVRRARRADLVLARAADAERYRATPVYFGPGRRVLAGDMLGALAPVAAAAGDLVTRLAAKAAEHLEPDSTPVLTGAFASAPPVRNAVVAALGRGREVCLPLTAAAEGALLVAEGRIRADEDYPHTLGLAVRRVHKGRLESTVLTVAERGRPLGMQAPVPVRVSGRTTEPVPVRVRGDGAGDWKPLVGNAERPLGSGDYTVEVRPGRTTTGVLVFQRVDGAGQVRVPLAETSGEEEGQ
jgi:hypothetical protein